MGLLVLAAAFSKCQTVTTADAKTNSGLRAR